MIAAAANAATAPVALLLPLKGLSMLDSCWRRVLGSARERRLLRRHQERLRPDIPVIELDCNINDPSFAEAAADTLLNLMRQSERDKLAAR